MRKSVNKKFKNIFYLINNSIIRTLVVKLIIEYENETVFIGDIYFNGLD